ncbi:hypothetical protein [Thalassospira sp. CH_XMU1448-2]|uniref:hypothetical protein n=1 Tax=Thalassospira sp. CH_XMU1448-2 TaxID=3107773 RepID=UPI00300AAAAD
MTPFYRVMDKVISIVAGNLFPLWLVGANLIARLGGMIILLLIGHSFSPEILGSYFTMLATAGLAVTATQAGSGPLLIRLMQGGALPKALFVVAIRLLIAGLAVSILVSRPEFELNMHWPFLIMPVAAALSPDWVIAARTEFGHLGKIALIAQATGITFAVIAAEQTNDFLLFTIAPVISFTAFLSAIFLALRPTTSRRKPVNADALDIRQSIGLIGFTLLAGFLPNLDFVLLGNGEHSLFLAQRIFLFCGGLVAAISATFFAKQHGGLARDLWFFVPMSLVSLALLVGPDQIANLIYGSSEATLISVLQNGAFWPLLLALVTRQCLILQETARAAWVGWFLLFMLVGSAAILPNHQDAIELIITCQLRLAAIYIVLSAFPFWSKGREARL